MSEADKMFEKLGYNTKDGRSFEKWDLSFFAYIVFSKEWGVVELGEGVMYSPELHLAIHEKMKELQWIEQAINYALKPDIVLSKQ